MTAESTRYSFLIDRKDLDDQTVDEYSSFDPGCVDATDSTKELVKMLEDSSKKMIITTIQKMANALKKQALYRYHGYIQNKEMYLHHR